MARSIARPWAFTRAAAAWVAMVALVFGSGTRFAHAIKKFVPSEAIAVPQLFSSAPAFIEEYGVESSRTVPF
jgi:hypothetical protein